MVSSLLQSKPRLGDLLLKRGYLTPDQLDEALAYQHASGTGELLGEILISQQLCPEDKVLECVAAEYGIPYVALDSKMFDPKAVELVPRDFIEKHTILPLFRIRNVLTVAVTEPSNVFMIDQLRETTGCDIQIALASPRDVRRVVQTYLPNTRGFVIDDIIDDVSSESVELIQESIEDITFDLELAGQSPIIKLVNYVIFNAVKDGASDIHIEPGERQIRVRYRVDGALLQAIELPMHIAPALASRIKIMASMDISERRLPQDGRVHVLMQGRPIDLRVSTLPSPHGEKVVIRVLDSSSINLSLPQLGFSAENLERFNEQIEKPNGIVLVTGPTGSGKSTTLYATLNAVTSMERNVCTVEDPIEYQLPMVNQFQVNDRIGLTFATVLRSLLRQDPDIMMVGEIRDAETARISIQAALTGHLVFSTLHTNDACSAVTRLVNMGLESYLLAASLNMVLSQRLCRRVCSKCRQAYEPPKVMQMAMAKMGLEVKEFTRGVGCKRCRNTGFSGRVAIHEVLVVDEELRDLIVKNPSLTSIREYARRSNMLPLRYDGLRKVREGLTTIEEVFQASDEGWLPVRK